MTVCDDVAKYVYTREHACTYRVLLIYTIHCKYCCFLERRCNKMLCCVHFVYLYLNSSDRNAFCLCVCVSSDDNKALWGINIMKKAKKPGSPKAFGVRLEDCQPALNHKVRPLCVFMISFFFLHSSAE